MLKRAVTACFIVLAISLCPALASAQWVIHALGGTLKTTNASAKTIVLDTDDGTPGDFQIPQISKVNMNFDKEVRSETVAPDKFTDKDGQVIVFFYGDGVVRTAVAVESAGTGPFQKITGTVLKYDKHDHMLTLQTQAGEKTFAIGDKTIVDTPDGVVPGRKFNAERGDHLRLLAAQTKGSGEQTLLVRFDGNPT
jgi:hypothetical protein